MIKNIVVFGATSSIAHETVKHFASQGARFVLVGRNQLHLEQVANDLNTRGANQLSVVCSDLADTSGHQMVWQQALAFLGSVDLIFLAHGVLGDQHICENSAAESLNLFQINALSYVSLLTISANYFEIKKSGCIAAITSVAGMRGRKSNYVYGASKAAIIAMLQGIRNRLNSSGISVVDIRPGFIDTPMTTHIAKKPLVASAQVAGRIIFEAIEKKRDVVYVPFRWFVVMTIIKLIPERIFKRMNL